MKITMWEMSQRLFKMIGRHTSIHLKSFFFSSKKAIARKCLKPEPTILQEFIEIMKDIEAGI